MSVHLETFSPLPRTICLNLPVQTTIHDVLQGLVEALNLPSSTLSSLRITTSSLGSLSIPANATLSSLQHSGTSDLPLTLKVNHVLIGGKGGFGSMLRAQGGKMSAGKNKDNNDSCRDLNGRRLSTMKEAKKWVHPLLLDEHLKRLVELVASAPSALLKNRYPLNN